MPANPTVAQHTPMGFEDFQRVARIIAAIKCPNIRLSVSAFDNERVWLHVYTDVRNVLDDTQPVSIGADRWVRAAQPAAALVRYAIDVAQEVVLHEFLEWVKVDGERVVDPHADDQRFQEVAFRVAVRRDAR